MEDQVNSICKAGLRAGLTSLAGVLLTAQIASAAPQQELKVRNSVGWGEVVTDQAGRSLYVFTLNDAGANVGACEEKCLDAWPPLIVKEEPAAGKMVEADRISTIVRPDGRRQVAYDGWPLFYYHKDEGNDTYGQDIRDFGGSWDMIAPDGTVATQHILPTPSPTADEESNHSE